MSRCSGFPITVGALSGAPYFFQYDPGYNTFFRTIRFRTFTFAKNGKN
ncbi:hypothetical protein RB2501_02965 [Robiginitalea biformata HTCC2501]|uniref:Uncharacterized protein n=1 Tax=Robiginitalea biformata (strain ATCC BAA-864 / DSM 15991 / KCTC 12146 / HTCC2501) TaxID=313596 RepID=A4CPN0_ROBBH|nr:hypothetical protein RB2501_02965 [Robiginitalea biformata HTCC2501]